VFSCYLGVFSWYLGVLSWYLGVFSCYLGVFSWYLGVSSWYLGVFSCYLGVFSCYLGAFSCYLGVFSWYLGVFSWYAMGWLRVVGSLILQVSFAKETYERGHILQKNPILLRTQLTVTTPYKFFFGLCISLWDHEQPTNLALQYMTTHRFAFV